MAYAIDKLNNHTLPNALAEARDYALHYHVNVYVLASRGQYYVHTECSANCSPALVVAKIDADGNRISQYCETHLESREIGRMDNRRHMECIKCGMKHWVNA